MLTLAATATIFASFVPYGSPIAGFAHLAGTYEREREREGKPAPRVKPAGSPEM